MDICTAQKYFSQLQSPQSRPLSGLSIELTRRCNFRCHHCYCVIDLKHAKCKDEITGRQWQQLFSQFAQSGVLDLTITGGEPLLHPDFTDIWKAAKNNGFLVTLFTNGSLIDDDIVALLAEWSPVMVSITLYGASETTYRKVTKRSGMFDQAMINIRKLAKHKIPLQVKGVFSKINWSDFDNVKTIASSFCDGFMWDAQLMGPFADCANEPQALRVDISELVQKERDDPYRFPFLRDGSWKPAQAGNGGTFRCGVGVSSAHVDPYGFMHPCLPLDHLKYDLLQGSVKDAWEKFIPQALASVPVDTSPCQSCEAIEICAFCPAFAYLEGAPANGPIPYKCELTSQRTKIFNVSDQLTKMPPTANNTIREH